MYEPRVRPILGAEEIDSLGDMNVELELYRTTDATRIPAQGTALTTEFLRSVGKRSNSSRRPIRQSTAAATGGLDARGQVRGIEP